MELKEAIQEKVDLINNKLKEYLSPDEPAVLYEAMGYSVFAGGKRVRPVLLLLVHDLYGREDNAESAVAFGCGLEMIHTYSLIHDDLPVMDDDDLRRGKPTNHKVFGEALALLAGDGLLNKAFEIFAEICLQNSSHHHIRAMEVIAKASGSNGMIGGQVLDLGYGERTINLDGLLEIHKNKTAKLFQAALVSGGILGGADEEEIKKLNEIGEKLGIAFQIKDDILDVTSTSTTLGKNINSDEQQDKITVVSLLGLEKAEKEYSKLCGSIRNMIGSLKCNSIVFTNYIDFLLNREM